MIYRWLFPLLWIVFIVFWIAMARGGKAVAERESVYSRLSHYLPLGDRHLSVAAPHVPIAVLDEPLCALDPVARAVRRGAYLRRHRLRHLGAGVDRGQLELGLDALGSGTDYTAFLDHLGIATLDLGYADEDEGGIYHSVYDDFYWYTHFSDKDFVYGRALAQTVGTSVMRLADAEVLPFDFVNLETPSRCTPRICRSCSPPSRRRFASATGNWMKACSRRRLIPGVPRSRRRGKRCLRT